jgi:hypothetical protein
VLIAGVGAVVTRLEYRAGASLGGDSTRFALASHLLDGRIPYRTLLTYRPPGSYAFDALVLGLAGRTVGAQHLAAFLAGEILYPLLTYAAARTLVRRAELALAASLAVALFVSPVPGVQLACALVALVLVARWIRTGMGSPLFAAGVAAGAEVAFALDLAGGLAVAVVVVVVVRALAGRRTPSGTIRVPTLQPLVVFAAGVMLGTAPLFTALGLDGATGNFARYVVNTARRAAAGASFPVPAFTVTSARFYVPVLALPVLLALFGRAARDEGLRDRALVAVLFAAATALRMASAAVVADGAHAAAALADVPLLAAWLADWILAARGRIRMHRFDVSFALGLGVLVAAVWRIGEGRPAYALLPPLAALVAAGAVGPRFAPEAPRRTVRITAIIAVLAVLPVGLTIAPGRVAGSARGDRLSGAEWNLALAAEIRAAVEAVHDAAPNGSTMFAFPSAGALYALAGRTNPTSFVELDAGVERWEVRRALDELRRDEPDVVVVRYRQAGEWSFRLAAVTRWLEDRYVETRRLERPELWGIWVRRDLDERCRRLTLYAFAEGPSRGVSPTVRQLDRERNVLVQRVGSVRFPAVLDRGSFIRFAVDRASADASAERTIDVVAGGHRVTVWQGVPDSIEHRIVLPPLPDTRADVVLLSPRGKATLWDEPVVCSPA